MVSPLKRKFVLQHCYYCPSSEALIKPVVGESLLDLYYFLAELQGRVPKPVIGTWDNGPKDFSGPHIH
jgi:hypothetical protein